ncbi:MAG: hypothetical protein HW412_771, partial [Bacteroidetes bacterium]|nr:hypothetical protein [Bacteroidota bacterium]
VGATERFLQHLEPYLTGKNHKEAL